MSTETGKDVTRRNMLASTAAGVTALAASALALPAQADDDHEPGLYGHGMVWNSAYPGIAGEVKLQFDIWVDLQGGRGHGVVSDPLHPDWECYFAITSVAVDKKNDLTVYKMIGGIVRATMQSNVGYPVKIYAEAKGEATGIGIALADLGFGGAGTISRLSFRSPSSFTTVTATTF